MRARYNGSIQTQRKHHFDTKGGGERERERVIRSKYELKCHLIVFWGDVVVVFFYRPQGNDSIVQVATK